MDKLGFKKLMRPTSLPVSLKSLQQKSLCLFVPGPSRKSREGSGNWFAAWKGPMGSFYCSAFLW
jgi:hypothetical protein